MQDLRIAYRSLRATPVVTVAVILSLGLGIGASTAIFSLVDGLMLRSLPVREPERLVHVNYTEESGRNFWATYPAWEAIRDRNLFEGAFAWSAERLELALGGQTEFADAIWVSPGFFEVLGVRSILGRTFQEADAGAEHTVAVLSHGFWQRRFGGQPGAPGQPITIEGAPFTVIGVTPPGFFGPDVGRSFDIAIPLPTMPLIAGRERHLENPPRVHLRVMARLEDGQSIDQASSALRRAQPAIRETSVPSSWRAQDREAYMREPLTAIPAATGTSSLRARYQRPLIILGVIIGLVLLIACGNVANLLLARASGRKRELGIRAALGASRLRLSRQLFSESLLLSGAAAFVGLLFGLGASRLLVARMSTVLETVVLALPLDGRVLGFTMLTGLVTAAVFGILPAIRASQADANAALNGEALASSRSRRLGPGSLLVVAQVALSLMLVVGAGLFLRTFSTLANLELGFEPHRVLMVDVNFGRSELEPTLARYERVCEAARSVPGAAHAACSPAIPIGFRALTTIIDMEENGLLPEQERTAHKNLITPDWFETFGTRRLAGRDFTWGDRAGAPRVAIVNEAFAKRFLEDVNPVGQTIREDRGARGKPRYEIVALVEDAVYRSVREPPPPTIYLPLAQEGGDQPWPFLNVVVRPRSGSPAGLAASVVRALREADADIKLEVHPMEEQVNATFNQERVLAMVASIFGGIALILASLGLYGLSAHGVSRRRRELAIRMALGADSRRLLRIVLGRVVATVVLGIVIGGVSSLWAVRFVQSLLFGLPARDASLFAGAALVLSVSAAAASWLPARRAVRMEPGAILREG